MINSNLIHIICQFDTAVRMFRIGIVVARPTGLLFTAAHDFGQRLVVYEWHKSSGAGTKQVVYFIRIESQRMKAVLYLRLLLVLARLAPHTPENGKVLGLPSAPTVIIVCISALTRFPSNGIEVWV